MFRESEPARDQHGQIVLDVTLGLRHPLLFHLHLGTDRRAHDSSLLLRVPPDGLPEIRAAEVCGLGDMVAKN